MVTYPVYEYEYNNKTLWGIHSKSARYTWAGFYLFVVLSSLIGDMTILIASIRYRAFRLHKVVVIIIEHIAVSDILVSVTLVIPMMISFVANDWVFGESLCYISAYLSHICYSVSGLLICTMAVSKLMTLKSPLRITTRKTVHMVCAGCWLTILSTTLIFISIDKSDVYFSYRSYMCAFGYSADVWQWLRPLIMTLVHFIPTCLVVGSTINLMVIAKRVVKRSRGSLKWQGIITTVLTATVSCASTIPYVVYTVSQAVVQTENKSQSFFHTTFFRLGISFLFLNTISNFYIYSLTVKSFRKFLRSKFQVLNYLIPSTTTHMVPGI